ncbi:MAG: pentapeptide repeat-containing protein [Deltaproteobacteria bacterium]|nr:pentapeptide repeat-containing protein [Deltaproteobacteria bacterium]
MADEQLVALMHDEKHAEFNEYARKIAEQNMRMDLSHAKLRACDLRKFDLRGADLTGAYLRLTDLRGLDLSTTLLDGASIGEAKISGVLFPPDLPATEIQLSHLHGTRMRATR